MSLTGDGSPFSPDEHLRLLTRIADGHGGAQGSLAETYLEGGAVEQLEQTFAKELGKERVIFFPTGTLANRRAGTGGGPGGGTYLPSRRRTPAPDGR